MSDIRISDALQALRPNSEYSVTGNVYSGIDWLDKFQTKPTEGDGIMDFVTLLPVFMFFSWLYYYLVVFQ